MEIKDDEIMNFTDFRRGLTGVADDLSAGKRDKIVVMKNGRLQFVVLTPPKYEELAK